MIVAAWIGIFTTYNIKSKSSHTLSGKKTKQKNQECFHTHKHTVDDTVENWFTGAKFYSLPVPIVSFILHWLYYPALTLCYCISSLIISYNEGFFALSAVNWENQILSRDFYLQAAYFNSFLSLQEILQVQIQAFFFLKLHSILQQIWRLFKTQATVMLFFFIPVLETFSLQNLNHSTKRTDTPIV